MPAPVPIQIRYGPAGLLAQAVAQAGYNQGNAERDFSFINSQMASRDHMAQVYAQQNQAADQLQQAYAMHTGQQQQQRAPDPYANAGNDANASLLKQTYLQSAASDIPEAEKANLTMLAKARNISPEQFRLAVGDAAKRGNTNTDEAADADSKKAYVKSILPNLPAEAQAGILSLANDRRTTAAQLRVAGDAIIQRTALGQRVQTSEQIQGLDRQIADTERHMHVLASSLSKDGVNVDGPPAALNPTYSTGHEPQSAATWLARNSAVLPYKPDVGIVTAPGNPSDAPAFKAFLVAKNLRDKLQAQRAALANGGGSDGVSQPAAKQITPEIAAQFLQQAQGNKDAARQMAAQQGYSF